MIRLLLAILAASGTVTAQAQLRFDAGLGLAFPLASTSFRSLPGFPSCCPEFASGSGTAFAYGVGVDIPVVGNLIMSVRGSSIGNSHTLSTGERISVIVDGRFTSAEVTHTIQVSQQAYSLDALVGYQIRSLTLRAGVGYAIRGNATLTAEEQLSNPPGATFVDSRTSVRNNQTGAMPQPITSTLQFGTLASIRFPLDARQRWSISPEVGLVFPTSGLTSSVNWNLVIPTASIRISWQPFDTESKPVMPAGSLLPPVDEPARVSSLPEESLPAPSVVELEVLGNPTVVVEEIEQESFLPVLPYVFFDPHSDVVHGRYREMLRKPLPTIPEPADVFHRRIITLVAERMKKYSSSTLTITGTTSEREHDPRLAEQRAFVVAKTLIETYGIDRRRLVTKVRGLPENPSKATGEEVVLADNENSRVEFESSDQRVFMPYFVSDTALTLTPPQLQIIAKTEPTSGLREWSLSVNDHEVRTSKQAFVKPVVVAPSAAMIRELMSQGQMRIRIDGEVNGEAVDAERVIAVQQKRLFSKRKNMENDSIVETYQLIVFPYNSALLTSMHRAILDTVRARVGKHVRYTIEGATDIIGVQEINASLSLRRAQAVAEYLGGNATVYGRGEPSSDFPQELPEQRMLERTVRIRAVVPVQRR